MEPARCEICNNPMSDWLLICDKLNVCRACASTVTLSSLVGMGYAKAMPFTLEYNGTALVTNDADNDVPEVVNTSYHTETPEIVRQKSYDEETVHDETETHYNALEGQTSDEPIGDAE